MHLRLAGCVCLVLGFAGCQVLAPVPIDVQRQKIPAALIEDGKPQVEIGRRQPLIDGIGWVVGIPSKILLWDRRVDNHRISEGTVLATADYLERNNLPHIKVRANQYAPIQDWHRLRKNDAVAWPWRYSLGIVQLAGETIFPGRVFGGDHFNPFTQTVHLYSDVPAIALHEGGHAKDFTRRKYPGTYAAAYLFVPLWHETLASQDVFAYLASRGDVEGTMEANRILYPAYGTYVGNGLGYLVPKYATPVYYASVLAGHANGRLLNRKLVTEAPHPLPGPVIQGPVLPVNLGGD